MLLHRQKPIQRSQHRVVDIPVSFMVAKFFFEPGELNFNGSHEQLLVSRENVQQKMNTINHADWAKQIVTWADYTCKFTFAPDELPAENMDVSPEILPELNVVISGKLEQRRGVGAAGEKSQESIGDLLDQLRKMVSVSQERKGRDAPAEIGQLKKVIENFDAKMAAAKTGDGFTF